MEINQKPLKILLHIIASVLTLNITCNVTMSIATFFGYIHNHHQSVQKKKRFDMYPQNLETDLKTYNEFICKISIKNVV